MRQTLYDVYRGPVTVWVEDPLTHAVLTQLWPDREINVVSTQGRPGVLYMVNANPDPHRFCVLGVVDRDLDDDNEARWGDPGCRVFRLPGHEMENLLLDFEVLAALAKGSTAAAIQAAAQARAVEMCWWMVHKAVLRTLQSDLGASFPGDVATDGTLHSAADVEGVVRASSYWTIHAAALARWTGGTALHDEVERWGRRFQADLQTGAWTSTFSGKEILRHLRGHIRGLDETPRRPPNPTSAERDLDLGKRIARQMNEMRRVPEKLVALRAVVRAKAGL